MTTEETTDLPITTGSFMGDVEFRHLLSTIGALKLWDYAEEIGDPVLKGRLVERCGGVCLSSTHPKALFYYIDFLGHPVATLHVRATSHSSNISLRFQPMKVMPYQSVVEIVTSQVRVWMAPEAQRMFRGAVSVRDSVWIGDFGWSIDEKAKELIKQGGWRV